jgi:hypothetical protein
LVEEDSDVDAETQVSMSMADGRVQRCVCAHVDARGQALAEWVRGPSNLSVEQPIAINKVKPSQAAPNLPTDAVDIHILNLAFS